MFLQILKRKSLYTVSNLNYNLRSFHINHKYFLRKLISKHSSSNVKAEYVEQDIDPIKTQQNPNVNFLGIEGDEGVIVISDHKLSMHANFKSPEIKNRKEKFFKTNFGIIRNDSQNKLQYHGQYEKKEISEFPHCNTKQSEVSRVHKNTKLKSISSFSNGIIVPHEDSSNKHYGEDKGFSNHSKLANKCTAHEIFETDTFYDKLNTRHVYEKDFETNKRSKSEHVKSESFEQEFGSSESKDMNDVEKDSKSHLYSVSYIDENFFSSAVKEESDNKNIVISETSDEDLCYIDKQIFGDADCLKNVAFSVDQEVKIDINKKYMSSSKIPVEDLSHIDKEIFQNGVLLNKNATSNKQHSINNDYFNNSVNFNINAEELDYIDQEMFKSSVSLKSNSINDEQSVDSKDFDKNGFLKPPSNDNIPMNKDNLNEIKNLMPDISLFDTQNYIKYDSSAEKIISARLSYNKEQNFKKTKSNNFVHSSHKGTSNQDIDSDNELNTVIFNKKTYDAKHKNINHVKSNTLSSKERDMSEISDESSDRNGTALDFVEKLRKEQSLKSQSLRKAPVLGQDLFDSKGFRILKNQVPDLSNVTREEILTILKNNVLYSDDDLVILNKPYSLVIHESKTKSYPCLSQFLVDLAKEIDSKVANPKLYTVHRLDKETTGCLLLARNEMAADNIKSLFAQRKIIKKYWIVTSRVPDPLKGVIDIPVAEGSINSKKRMVLDPNIPKDIDFKSHSKRGKRAVTAYQVICISGNAALVEVTPQTGVKHQIRVHFGFGLSCPIIGDHKYSHLDKMAPQKLDSDLLQRLHVRQSKVRHIPMHIHAHSVTIPGYLEGRDLFVMAPLPYHIRTNLQKLKFKKKNKLRL